MSEAQELSVATNENLERQRRGNAYRVASALDEAHSQFLRAEAAERKLAASAGAGGTKPRRSPRSRQDHPANAG